MKSNTAELNRCSAILIVVVIAICLMAYYNPSMEPQTVITTDTSGISVTNIVMVKKTNGFDWVAFAELLCEVLEEVDFE
jgi:hypothetical protein